MTKSNRFASIRSTKKTVITQPAKPEPAVGHSVEKEAVEHSNKLSLSQMGWRVHFQHQLAGLDFSEGRVARISAHHRGQYDLLSELGETSLAVKSDLPPMTVGDWLLLDEQGNFLHLFERDSLFSRKAAGSKLERQLIASNLDWVFIVSSLNHDFNINRIERYLALVNDAKVTPVVVLTKQDLCDDISAYTEQLRALDSNLLIETVNGLDGDSVQALKSYCGNGKTVALIGSSGVGKSTLVNSLLGQVEQSTSGVRTDDSKGRHTTTGRSLHLMPTGGLLLDTPGMRELQLADCEDGVNDTFSELVSLAEQCRFGDCQHQQEPGCAVQDAISSGSMSERRLVSYQKLLREQALNGASIAEKRAQGRSQSKLYKRIQESSRSNKRG
ncbi:ribosome small subunit-dependent GTPase A [Shewanella canadensis]|uniref:Small ribosomal subunit biogenesis GTPase RsgA n=1 Tax=Shewanella canadensis TaxID=271096 RepID=A0A431WZV2_9GAMM|nr:ribosome small subunit-dependent GTPase A [Shewanella canadensis]RTR40912.1 ribosome small subunit-dependent GTPase A [Shewanella canadensis]